MKTLPGPHGFTNSSGANLKGGQDVIMLMGWYNRVITTNIVTW